MRILLVSDYEKRCLWMPGNNEMEHKLDLDSVDLILSAGDLNSSYLEHLTDSIKAPLVYIPGNHDEKYLSAPPKRCINADGRIVNLRIANQDGVTNVIIAGLGGSMRYNESPYQFTEEEQAERVAGLIRDYEEAIKKTSPDIKILLTHAPVKGFGDMDDIAHSGFSCFNHLIELVNPNIFCYGHVHEDYEEYSGGILNNSRGYQKYLKHPSGTVLVNGCGYCFIEIEGA